MLYEPLNDRQTQTAMEANVSRHPGTGGSEPLRKMRSLNGGFGQTPGINPMLPNSPTPPPMPQYSQQQPFGQLPWGNMFGAFGYNSFFSSGGRR